MLTCIDSWSMITRCQETNKSTTINGDNYVTTSTVTYIGTRLQACSDAMREVLSTKVRITAVDSRTIGGPVHSIANGYDHATGNANWGNKGASAARIAVGHNHDTNAQFAADLVHVRAAFSLWLAKPRCAPGVETDRPIHSRLAPQCPHQTIARGT
jgi:hypothetical protein